MSSSALRGCDQCVFEVHVSHYEGRFKASLPLPAASKLHASLVDAFYLLGYFLRALGYTELEPHFLRRTMRGIMNAP